MTLWFLGCAAGKGPAGYSSSAWCWPGPAGASCSGSHHCVPQGLRGRRTKTADASLPTLEPNPPEAHLPQAPGWPRRWAGRWAGRRPPRREVLPDGRIAVALMGARSHTRLLPSPCSPAVAVAAGQEAAETRQACLRRAGAAGGRGSAGVRTLEQKLA